MNLFRWRKETVIDLKLRISFAKVDLLLECSPDFEIMSRKKCGDLADSYALYFYETAVPNHNIDNFQLPNYYFLDSLLKAGIK